MTKIDDVELLFRTNYHRMYKLSCCLLYNSEKTCCLVSEIFMNRINGKVNRGIMKRNILALLLCFTINMTFAQKITRSFNGVSMSKALETISGMSLDHSITFIYDELEDFTVTTHVKNASVPDAIRQIIGFYPIRMTIDGKDIFVECIQKRAHKFSGKIISLNGEPIPYANIAILSSKDSIYITGGVSNEAGDFVIPCETNNVMARISCIGYKTINRALTKWNIGNIVMYESVNRIKEVTVKSERPIVKMEHGAMVYNMTVLQERLPSTNAYELLTRIPGVYDQNGSISYSGQSVALIIDGKLTTLSTEQVIEKLKSMPAEQLSKAEVMMSAPARYHVRGAAINVVTKVFEERMSGQLIGGSSCDKYTSGHAQGTLLYSRKNFSLDAYYSYAGGESFAKAEHAAIHPLGNARVPYSDTTTHKGSGITQNYRLGMEYNFSEDSRLNIAYSGKWVKNSPHNVQTGTTESEQFSHEHEYLHNVDISYSAPFGLKLNSSFLHFENPQTQSLTGDLTIGSESNQQINKWLFTADQTHQLGRGWALNYGSKAQWTNNKSWQTSVDGTGTKIKEATSRVAFEERIINGYAGLNKSFGDNFTVETSLTLENYNRPGWNKWSLYPMLNVMWQVNQNNMLNLSFSSDATYPSYWSTLSSVYYSSAYTEIWGNPDLKPSHTYNTSLTWQLKRDYTFTLFAEIQPDFFVQLAYQPQDRLAVMMKETNFDYEHTLGLQASTQFHIKSWLRGNAFAVLIYSHDKSRNFFDLPFDRKKLNVIVGGNASVLFSEKPDIRLILNPFFQGPAIQGIYDIKTVLNLDAILRYTISKHCILSFSADNILNRGYNCHSGIGNQDFSMHAWTQWRRFSLNFVYTFGNYKEKQHKKVDTSRMGH